MLEQYPSPYQRHEQPFLQKLGAFVVHLNIPLGPGAETERALQHHLSPSKLVLSYYGEGLWYQLVVYVRIPQPPMRSPQNGLEWISFKDVFGSFLCTSYCSAV